MEDQKSKEKKLPTVRQDIIDLLAMRIVKMVHPKTAEALEKVNNSLPKTSKEVRDLPFYMSTLNVLKYQRDNYLVGTRFADRRQKLRDQGIVHYPIYRMPFDSNALGNIQIVNLASWFIPSPTIKDSLLPIVLSLPSGVLKETITDAVANAIPLAQPQLDNVVKNILINSMKDPEVRQLIKSSAGGYMSSRDDARKRNSGK